MRLSKTLVPLGCYATVQEAEGTDEDIDRAIQRAMQRAIAAEAALAAAVVAGEVDLTVVGNDREGEQAQAPGPEANAEVSSGDGARVGVGTRRSAPMRSDDDAAAEVCLSCHQ